jgi:hypothetical protein
MIKWSIFDESHLQSANQNPGVDTGFFWILRKISTDFFFMGVAPTPAIEPTPAMVGSTDYDRNVLRSSAIVFEMYKPKQHGWDNVLKWIISGRKSFFFYDLWPACE